MENRFDDEDNDVLAAFTNPFSSSSSTAYPNYHADNFPVSDHQQEQQGNGTTATSSQRFSSDDRIPPKVFDRFYDSSSEEDEFFSASSGSSGATSLAGKRLDYMIQFLDRKLSSSENVTAALPEFVASGGGNGVFKVPVRAAVHPGRPPCLELRPHPLRETQVGSFLRNLVCIDDSQLWAGSECGVRFWNSSEIYSSPGMASKVCPSLSGDEETALFRQSVRTSPTLCLAGDAGNRVVWSGHRDGKIRCWKMDQRMDHHSQKIPFSEDLSWQAHRGPVLSIVITSYGDIWSGSESGVIKTWPWEAIEKSLSLTTEERHMAALWIERSYIDLRNQVSVNGGHCNIFSSDVKYMLSVHSWAKVWTAGYMSFALWDARTRELLKIFNIDDHIENIYVVQEPTMEEDVRIKSVTVSKKEKSQSSVSFFQRSRNAIMGAADAVRRVAVKGGFGDDNRRTEALVKTIDGMIWTGFSNGLLVQWDVNGNRLQDFQYHSFSVHCFCTFGSRIWVGYASGTVQVIDLNGNLLGGWVAHNSPIIDIAVGSGYIFTLANHGGIRGWSITSPGPLDGILCSELSGKEFLYTKLESLKVLVGTWNVGQGRATQDSLISWLGSVAADVGIVVVGLQEVEMGAGFLAMSAAKETVGLEGSSIGQWWLDMVGKILDEGSTFTRVGSRQLAGLLISVWVRNNIRGHVGDIDVAAVPCGFGRAIGNKGAVGLKMRVYGRIICFVNCHFAAHLDAVSRRNDDFDHVYRTMVFSRPSSLFNVAAAGVSSAIQTLRGANVVGISTAEGIPELSEADMVVFLGDFNYRLDGISYDEARDFISQRCFDWLMEKDQLISEMKAGNVFQGMREGVVRFPPTYKFERHQAGLAGYDSGEKKRIPAWCDRILYRDNRSTSVPACNLDCPVVSSVSQYEACMDVTDSDHKPVRCIFNVEIARVDESVRRQEFGEIIGSNVEIWRVLEELCKVPEAIISTNNIILQNHNISILRITNKSRKGKVLFEIVCEGESTIKEDGQASNHRPRGSFGFPRWLEVSPATGVIKPDHIVEISVHHEQYQTLEEFIDGVPQNCWCEDARDKEVILVVKVRGSCTTETKCHRIRVRHSLSVKTIPIGHKTNDAVPSQTNVLHRSDYQRLSSSYDMVNHLKSLHTP